MMVIVLHIFTLMAVTLLHLNPVHIQEEEEDIQSHDGNFCIKSSTLMVMILLHKSSTLMTDGDPAP